MLFKVVCGKTFNFIEFGLNEDIVDLRGVISDLRCLLSDDVLTKLLLGSKVLMIIPADSKDCFRVCS